MRMFRRKIVIPVYLVAFVLAAGMMSRCNCGSKRVSLSDPEVAPLLAAIAAVDRAAMGFTPISMDAGVRLEIGPRPGYDAMLHIYGATHRTISFRKTSNGYRWIGEQEIHYGPNTFWTPDGDIQESISVNYEVENTPGMTGVPPNQVCIFYHGLDARLAFRRALTLADIKPILAEWKGTRIR